MSNINDFIRAEAPAVEFISDASASNDANIDFTLPAGFDEYEIRMLNIVAATDDAPFHLRTSTDGGSVFDSGASDYIWSVLSAAESTASVSSSTGDTQIVLSGGIGDAVSQAFSGLIRIVRPAEATETMVYGTSGYANSSVTPKATFGGSMGQRQSAADVDAVRFLFSSGNIVSGLFALYGVNRA